MDQNKNVIIDGEREIDYEFLQPDNPFKYN